MQLGSGPILASNSNNAAAAVDLNVWPTPVGFVHHLLTPQCEEGKPVQGTSTRLRNNVIMLMCFVGIIVNLMH